MILHRLGSFLLVAPLFAIGALAQDPPRRDPQALLLLQQSFLVLGRPNLDVIRDTRSAVQGATLGQQGRVPFSAVITTLGSKTMRIDANTADGSSVVVANETTASIRRGSEQVQRVPRASVTNGGFTHLPLLSVVAEWVQPKVTLEYLGLEALEGAPAHHIRIRSPWPGTEGPAEDPPPCEVYLDAKTLLPIQLVYPTHSATDHRISEPVTVTYRDYRAVSGLAIPHTVSQSIRGQVVSEFRVINFSVNQGIALSQFELR